MAVDIQEKQTRTSPAGASLQSVISISDHDESPVVREKLSTVNDQRDMNRLGKVQQLRRNFGFLPILGYALVLGSVWEFALLGALFSLPNGGPGGSIWMYVIVAIFYYLVTLSMAEMASIAPTAGGQYHWVSEFAPRKYQKLLSFLVGWLVVLSWQSGLVGTAYIVAQQIEAIIVLSDSNYVIKGWHGALFTIATALFAIFFNTTLIRKLPQIEGFAVALHILGFFTFVIVLWVMGPRADARTVFTEFQDNNGWGSLGLATLIGIISPINTLGGADAVCHLSEELRDASRNLPRAMISNASINIIIGFIITITLMFTVGDVQQVLASPTGQPYVQILLNATESRGATIVLTATMTMLLLFCAINGVTTASRQLFAFARDKGLPFSEFLSTIQPGSDIPLNAVVVTLIFTALISMIIIGSTIAFNITVSLGTSGLFASYIVAIGCVLHRRLYGEPLPPSPFSLGRAGLWVNIASLAFLLLSFVMLFFPAAPNPSPQSMNWVSLIFGSVLIFAGFYYHFRGQYTYVGPVVLVRREE